jgi:hypothetical protein
LREYRLLSRNSHKLSAGADRGQESFGVELARVVSRRNPSHGCVPLKRIYGRLRRIGNFPG